MNGAIKIASILGLTAGGAALVDFPSVEPIGSRAVQASRPAAYVVPAVPSVQNSEEVLFDEETTAVHSCVVDWANY